jgi:hypothetical protein
MTYQTFSLSFPDLTHGLTQTDFGTAGCRQSETAAYLPSWQKLDRVLIVASPIGQLA